MNRKKLGLLVSLGILAAAGCGRSEDANSTNTPAQQAPPPPETPAPATTPASATAEVASYPTQVVQSGTTKLAQQVKVHQAADPDSTMLTRLGPGTVVEKKASYGDWMLVNWPSGVGQTSPGWVQSSQLSAPAITDGGIPEAGMPPIPDAGPLDAGGAKASTIPRPTTSSGDSSKPSTTPPPNTTTKRPTFKITPN